MKKFKVIAIMSTYLEVEIEAKDRDDAFNIALDMDGGDFTPISDDGDWRIDDVVEIEE